MKLTVGIPTYNRSGLLREAIESVLAQDFTSFRVIVSDNASDDDTPEVVRSFADERIDYSRTERNIGNIPNYNRLVSLAETEMLVLLPDDDVLKPGHLAAAADALERFPTAGLAHSACDVLDARSRAVGSMAPLPTRGATVRLEPGERALERMMVSDWPICFSSVAYRTRAIIGAGGFRPNEEPFGDLQLWMRIAIDWDFVYLAKPLAGFRVHRETLTSDIGAQQGVATDERAVGLLHDQIRYERRTNFLADAALDARTTRRLRTRATLQLVVARDRSGLPWSDVNAGLVRGCPQVMLRTGYWRVAIAHLGARRARTALRRAVRRFRSDTLVM